MGVGGGEEIEGTVGSEVRLKSLNQQEQKAALGERQGPGGVKTLHRSLTNASTAAQWVLRLNSIVGDCFILFILLLFDFYQNMA